MSDVKNTGFFLVIDGVDGSGKSTQIKLLSERLKDLGYDVLVTREPGGTSCVGAEEIRNLVVNGDKDRWDGLTELLLFSAARRSHVETLIKPALRAGKIVICDRFVPSTIAYQGYGHGINLDVIDNITKIAIGDFKPDFLMIFTVDPEQGIERAQRRRGSEMRFESMDLNFQKRVAFAYEVISTKYHKYANVSLLIDTTQKENESVEDCISSLTNVIFNNVEFQILNRE